MIVISDYESMKNTFVKDADSYLGKMNREVALHVFRGITFLQFGISLFLVFFLSVSVCPSLDHDLLLGENGVDIQNYSLPVSFLFYATRYFTPSNSISNCCCINTDVLAQSTITVDGSPQVLCMV